MLAESVCLADCRSCEQLKSMLKNFLKPPSCVSQNFSKIIQPFCVRLFLREFQGSAIFLHRFLLLCGAVNWGIVAKQTRVLLIQSRTRNEYECHLLQEFTPLSGGGGGGGGVCACATLHEVNNDVNKCGIMRNLSSSGKIRKRQAVTNCNKCNILKGYIYRVNSSILSSSSCRRSHHWVPPPQYNHCVTSHAPVFVTRHCMLLLLIGIAFSFVLL